MNQTPFQVLPQATLVCTIFPLNNIIARSLPSFAAICFVGAGGLVINDKNQLLAVCERFSKKKHWKLPGGMVDRGEN